MKTPKRPWQGIGGTRMTPAGLAHYIRLAGQEDREFISSVLLALKEQGR